MTPAPLEVVAALVLRGDTLLLCQRPAHKHHGGLWELPGGKIDPGESPPQALARELREELALLDVAVGRLVFVDRDPHRPVVISFFEVVCDADPAPHEHDALVWVDLASALRIDLAPADRRCLEHLARHASPRSAADPSRP